MRTGAGRVLGILVFFQDPTRTSHRTLWGTHFSNEDRTLLCGLRHCEAVRVGYHRAGRFHRVLDTRKTQALYLSTKSEIFWFEVSQYLDWLKNTKKRDMSEEWSEASLN